MARNRTKRRTGRSSGPVTEIRSANQLAALLEGDDPVVVDFWAPWCGPCKAMAPVFQDVASKFAAHDQDKDGGKRVRFAKVNTEAVPAIAAEFNIRSIPTLVVLLDGEVVDSNVGLTSADGLGRMARRALDRAEGRTLGQRLKRLFGGASAAAPSSPG